MGPESDEQLAQQAGQGDQRAFAELVKRYTRSVYRLALRLSANASDAEEILQDTFVQLHRKLESFRGDAKFSTWLHRVAVNASLMHLRGRSRSPSQELPEELPGFDASGTLLRLDVDYGLAGRVDELVDQRRLLTAVLAALQELPDLYRVPFVLRDLEGLTTIEAAELLGIEPELVRQRVHRTRLALRSRLLRLTELEPWS